MDLLKWDKKTFLEEHSFFHAPTYVFVRWLRTMKISQFSTKIKYEDSVQQNSIASSGKISPHYIFSLHVFFMVWRMGPGRGIWTPFSTFLLQPQLCTIATLSIWLCKWNPSLSCNFLWVCGKWYNLRCSLLTLF